MYLFENILAKQNSYVSAVMKYKDEIKSTWKWQLFLLPPA